MSRFATWLEARRGRIAEQDVVTDQFRTLSRSDKRPGLSDSDMDRTVKQAVWLQNFIKDTGGAKASALASWVADEFAGKISPWVAKLLGFLAHDLARKRGLIP